MKSATLLLLPLLAFSSLTAFRPAPAHSASEAPAAERREVRTVAAFEELSLNIPAEVILRQGSPQRVEIVGAEEDLGRIETVVKENRLRIRLPEKDRKAEWYKGTSFKQPVKIYVTMPNIKMLGVSGSGSMSGETPIKAPALKVSMSGSGALRLNLVTDQLHTSLSGSGRISLSGSTDAHTVSISGSGQLAASNLRTNATQISISGSGNCQVHASQTLQASISGSGNVRYQGSPQVTSRVMGSGNVRKA
ncbi:hypothetical protein PK28_03055 [Hymenobacter sp. DG25B]|uniref:head GIN domain-containing protein n=1 Tax=Hymenobacter sp. DG25B TaxID=1385664 RepID=UPI000540C8D4|nr:head GIN domain-containing protein [Hymenobacter sp. DG25B]AIZ62917.1 hypothetical protein PK28_03055 [Hymenobacter sp. DG25B]